ncbi:unnamed protein product [Protopolystoma xenopodis]|uniref:Uncharacterized protein n=1 Tax=Protopolystoma xenopodis TaxID=117903 RepID=A0A448XIR4_9PLAT|nr:unnamed protein product [Protopolystoma xenopodis]
MIDFSLSTSPDFLSSDLTYPPTQLGSVSPSALSAASGTVGSIILGPALRRPHRSRDGLLPDQVNTLGEGDWEKMQQNHVLASVQQVDS